MAKIEGIDNIEFTEATVDDLTVTGSLISNGLIFESGQNPVISVNSTDGNDTSRLQVTAGGLPASDRSARLELYANEFSTTADRGNIKFKTGSDAAVASGGGNRIIFETGDNNLLSNRWSIESNGVLLSQGNVISDYGLIGVNTTDGSDDKGLIMSSVNGVSDDRGASIEVYGNEYSTVGGIAGDVYIRAGNVSGGQITMRTAANDRWYVTDAGTLRPASNNSVDIGNSSFSVSDIWTYDINMPGSSGGWVADVNTGATTWYVQADKTGNTDFNFLNQFSGATARLRVIGDAGSSLIVDGQTMTVPFTGCHRYEKGSSNPQEGDAVRLVSRKLEICISENDPTCIGIITSETITTSSGSEDPDNPTISFTKDSFGTSFDHAVGGPHTLHCVASVGDAKTTFLLGAKVCNEGGDLVDGDLLCTASGHPGHLKKQDDDIVRSYTVAQVREDVSFSGSATVSGAYVYLLK